MGTKHDRATRELDRDQLRKLARETGESAVVVAPQEESPSSPRTTTLQDPMTMALLAEVARNSQTRDFGPEALPQEEEVPEETALPHPNLKRR